MWLAFTHERISAGPDVLGESMPEFALTFEFHGLPFMHRGRNGKFQTLPATPPTFPSHNRGAETRTPVS